MIIDGLREDGRVRLDKVLPLEVRGLKRVWGLGSWLIEFSGVKKEDPPDWSASIMKQYENFH